MAFEASRELKSRLRFAAQVLKSGNLTTQATDSRLTCYVPKIKTNKANLILVCLSGGTGRFFSARLGLGLRKVGPFGLGLWAQKSWPDRAELGPVRAILNNKLLVLFSDYTEDFLSIKVVILAKFWYKIC